MNELGASTGDLARPGLAEIWARGAATARRWLRIHHLRGLSAGRVGIVFALCALLTVRQTGLCVFQIGCNGGEGATPVWALSFLGRQFVFALPMLLAVTVVDNVTLRSSPRVRIFALAMAVLFGALVYAPAFFFTQSPNVPGAAGREYLYLIAHFSRALAYGGMATAALHLFSRERDDARALHAARLEKVSLDRQTIEAHLQALQAQIEPHFLFNTLANIKLLYETDPSLAKPLIHDLAAYLRTALPQMREAGSTLARELNLTEAYLRVLQVRMGERLRVAIDVPAHLKEAALPPMMLLTLVENGVKHGLASLPQGGTITIRAELVAERLLLSVIDNGVGFPKGFGTGVGLANTRARLTALYGDAGRLVLAANPGGGVVAQVEIPFAYATHGRSAA